MNKVYKNNLEHYYDITPVVDMKGFVTLLLADIASKDNFNKADRKIAYLPMDYKARIEKIIYAENGWGIKFSRFIDIEQYYEDQLEWECELGKTINYFLSNPYDDTCKSWHTIFNFETDYIEIPFTVEEIEEIKNRYDLNTLEIMDHFSNLIVDYAFSRKFNIDQREMDRHIKRSMDQYYNSLIRDFRSKGIKNPQKYLTKW